MQKKNRVLKSYKIGFSDPEWVSGGLEDIEYYAKNNTEEFQNLIDLFNSEKSVYNKLLLSRILINLNYEPIKDFFASLINDDENKLESEKYGPNWSHEHNKIWAAGRLLYLGDMRGKDFFEKIIDHVDQDRLEWIVLELYEETSPEESSMAGLECLLELADKHEKIANGIDRKAVEELLRRLRAGEKVTWERPSYE